MSNLNLPFKESAKELQAKAEIQREEDRLVEALQTYDMAILACQTEGNYELLSETIQGKGLTWKHLFLLTGDKSYALIALKDTEAALEIIKNFHLDHKLSRVNFRLGDTYMLFENYTKAIEHYQQSMSLYTGSLSEKGDFRYHLGEAIAKNGDIDLGKKTMLEGLAEINSGAAELDPFLIHVWTSGCHMRLAEVLNKVSPEEARQHLQAAKEIIDSDPKLVIRKRQWEELSKNF